MAEKKEKNANIPSILRSTTKDELEKLFLDTKMNKYQLIPLALHLAKELQKTEGRNVPANVLLEHVLTDILTGKVKLEEIKKK